MATSKNKMTEKGGSLTWHQREHRFTWGSYIFGSILVLSSYNKRSYKMFYLVASFSYTVYRGISKSVWACFITLSLYTLTSVCIFSTLISKHFLRCWQGEFVWQPRASLEGDQFLYSPDFNVWFRGVWWGENRYKSPTGDKGLNAY